jgi:hypothetical protein
MWMCFRLLATDYQDMKDKLQIPVRNLRNVVIQQSLSDRFVHAFRQQVHGNPPFTKPPEMVSVDARNFLQIAPVISATI